MTRRRGVVVRLAALALLGATAAGCTGGADSSAPAGTEAAGDAGQATLATTAELGKLTGRLSPAKSERLVARVTAVVDGWMDAAFMAGEYPRSDFDAAFGDFTPGARREAMRDVRQMTNAALGERIDGVEPMVRRVVVDVLAPGHRPAAATARFRFAFRTSGEVTRRVTLLGRLYLARTGPDWTVFGFDVARGAR